MTPILIIDPGHGGKDPGGGSNSVFLEKNKALEISLYQLERFKQLGVPVSITRTEDVYLSPTARTDAVRKSGAKHCISNHINAYNNTARGAETIYSIFSDGKLATRILDGIVDKGMPKRRAFKKEGANGADYYFMHRQTGSVETVIIEYGFATHPEDTKLIINNWKAYAESVVKTFCEYIKHPYQPAKDTEKFSDIKNHWALQAIEAVSKQGLMNGYPDGTFQPDKPLTRAELATALVNFDKYLKGVK
jgi:N-acetylmuramoyl-L-alanine amidase